jgi:FKBP-type peptidyl-prolyl cis-trans isomerase
LDKYIVPAALILIVVAFFYFKNNLSSEDVKNNIAKGVEFLANNRTVEGVLETSSGLQYQVLQPGTGTKHPKASDTVKVHYHGTLLDGTVFDSSVNRGAPISFGLNRVIPGWTEGLQLMVVGEKTRFFIPANLAYGNSSAGKIEGGSLLIFEVELLAINE